MVDLADGSQLPVLLTEELLEELAARWQAQKMPIAEALRPGLDDQEMDRLTAPLGLTLPREARAWWGWHDGAESDSRGSTKIGPSRAFEPLSVAVSATLQTQGMMRGPDGLLDWMWRESWLRMSASLGVVVIDCGGGFDDPVPARHYRWDEPTSGADGVPSLGTLVRLYIDAFDRGVWRFDSDRGRWSRDANMRDPATRHLHLT